MEHPKKRLQNRNLQEGIKYCGRIAWLKEPLYRADEGGGMAGRPVVDRENPNPNLRSRMLIGLQLIEGFTYIGKNVWEKEPSTIPTMARPINAK